MQSACAAKVHRARAIAHGQLFDNIITNYVEFWIVCFLIDTIDNMTENVKSNNKETENEQVVKDEKVDEPDANDRKEAASSEVTTKDTISDDTEKKQDAQDSKMDVDDNDSQEDEDEEDDEAEDEESGEAAEPLATTRSRRSNAGNRMSKMIQDEEDEFYNNLYGGFHEEEDDQDFDSSDEEDDEAEDYDVDSDFSIDETDEIAPQFQEVEDERPKRKRGVYKDPQARGASSATTAKASSSGTEPAAAAQPRPKPTSSKATFSPSKHRPERSFRDSTKRKTEETIKNIRSSGKKRKRQRNLEEWIPPTQEEMLAEAKITEEENLKSLETYQRLESEKLKKIKTAKKTLPAPYTTYLSTTMPIIGTDKRYTRNFITFVT